MDKNGQKKNWKRKFLELSKREREHVGLGDHKWEQILCYKPCGNDQVVIDGALCCKKVIKKKSSDP